MAVTLQTIADAVGVSRMAVSLALRNSPQISEAKRKEIQRAAERLGYVSDPAVRALVRRRFRPSETPSGYHLVYLDDTPRLMPFHQRHREVVQDEARRLGYAVDFVNVGEITDIKKQVKRMKASGVRGMLLNNIRDLEVLVAVARELPCVACGNTPPFPPLNVVMPDHYTAVRECIGRICAAGVKRVGFWASNQVDWHQDYIQAGFLMAQQTYPEVAFKQLRVRHVDDARGRIDELLEWWDEFQPEVILAETSSGYHILKEALGRRIPEEVQFVALDVHRADVGKFAGMHHRAGQAAQVAMELLEGLMVERRVGFPSVRRTILVQSQWHDGSTFIAGRAGGG